MRFRKKNYLDALKILTAAKHQVDGLSKEFYSLVQEDLKKRFLDAINQAKTKKKLITS